MSAPALDCYDYIIGLYNGDCDCYAGKPDDFNVSNSGLYISDLLEPKMIDGLLNCDQGASIWELMEIVRSLAIRNWITDTNALLMKAARPRRNNYKGGIGRSNWTKNLALTNGDYAGVRMKAADVRSGFLRIKKIGVLINSTTTFDLEIYDTNANLLHTISLTSVADKHTQNTVDIELPLHDDYLESIEYFFLYTVNGFQPKNNDVSCTCDRQRPLWGAWSGSGKYAWGQWLQVGGYTGGDLPDFMWIDSPGSAYMYGLTFDVELGCYINDIFCEDTLDFDSNTLAQAMAVAIQKSAGALFIDKLLRTPNLNRTVMLDREGLQKAKEEYLSSYQTMTQYIVDNLDLSQNDCLECRDIVDMIAGGIMA